MKERFGEQPVQKESRLVVEQPEFNGNKETEDYKWIMARLGGLYVELAGVGLEKELKKRNEKGFLVASYSRKVKGEPPFSYLDYIYNTVGLVEEKTGRKLVIQGNINQRGNSGGYPEEVFLIRNDFSLEELERIFKGCYL